MSSSRHHHPQPHLQGYYAVRNGKHGLTQAIFLTWEACKDWVDNYPGGEFSFFAKMEDAISYLQQGPPTVKTGNSKATNAKTDDDKKASPTRRSARTKGKTEAESKQPPQSQQQSSSFKRKRIGVLPGRTLKKLRAAAFASASNENENDNDNEAGEGEPEGEAAVAEDAEMKDEENAKAKETEGEEKEDLKDGMEAEVEAHDKEEAKEGEGDKNNKDDNQKDEDNNKNEEDEQDDELKETSADDGQDNKKPKSKMAGSTNALDNLPSPSAPLNVLLVQGFQQNLPKGWRSQHLGLYLTRRDYFREPALKQYLQDLVDLQTYRENYSVPARMCLSEGGAKHFSGASHPLSVYYLNWSWGVCNSYHRDIRRQQKNKKHVSGDAGNNNSADSPSDEVQLPHFKQHSQRTPSKRPSQMALPPSYMTSVPNLNSATTAAISGDNNPTDQQAADSGGHPEMPSLAEPIFTSHPGKWKLTMEGPSPPTAAAAAAAGKQTAPTLTRGSRFRPDKNKKTASAGGGPVQLYQLLEQAYLGFRAKGWRARDCEAANAQQGTDNSSNKKEPTKESMDLAVLEQEVDPQGNTNSKNSGTDEKQPGDEKKAEETGDSLAPSNKTANSYIIEFSNNPMKDSLAQRGQSYQRDYEELMTFRVANPHKISKYRDARHPMVSGHPSGIHSPFVIRYLKWAWDIDDPAGQAPEADEMDEGLLLPAPSKESQQAASKTAAPSPARLSAAEALVGVGAAAAAASVANKSSGEQGPQPESIDTAVAAAAPAASSNSPADSKNEALVPPPPLMERLKESWFANLDKGWRSSELGFPTWFENGKSKNQFQPDGPFSRKAREKLYLKDLETLKQFWEDQPSSQYVVFAPPVDDPNDALEDNRGRERKHKSGINAPWSLTYLNWSWGVSNSYNRDLVRKEKRKAQRLQQEKEAAQRRQVGSASAQQPSQPPPATAATTNKAADANMEANSTFV